MFFFSPSPHTVPGTENNVHSSQDSCEHSWSSHDTAAPSTALVFLPSVMLLNCNCGMRDFCCQPYPVENNYGGYIFFQNMDDFEAAVQCEQL